MIAISIASGALAVLTVVWLAATIGRDLRGRARVRRRLEIVARPRAPGGVDLDLSAARSAAIGGPASPE